MSKTYAQLAREIAALQASADRQLAVEAKGAVAKINEMIAKYKLTAGDLKFASGNAVPAQQVRISGATKAKGKNAVNKKRYSDGQGNVWGGRGPRPHWLRSAIAAGRAIESFLTGGSPVTASSSDLPEAPVAKAAAAKKAAGKSAAGKRAVGRSPVAKESPVGKPAAKKTAAPSAAPVSASKAVATRPVAKKAPAKKIPAVKSTPTPKTSAKKTPTAKKSAVKAKTAPAAKKSVSKEPAITAPVSPVPAAT